eukprot:3281820-Rhodomonas_salina.4
MSGARRCLGAELTYSNPETANPNPETDMKEQPRTPACGLTRASRSAIARLTLQSHSKKPPHDPAIACSSSSWEQHTKCQKPDTGGGRRLRGMRAWHPQQPLLLLLLLVHFAKHLQRIARVSEER